MPRNIKRLKNGILWARPYFAFGFRDLKIVLWPGKVRGTEGGIIGRVSNLSFLGPPFVLQLPYLAT